MNSFLWQVPGFPGLCGNVLMVRAFGFNPGYDLTMKVWGVSRERDEWQRAFDLWCYTYGERPIFTRGNARTDRTEAKVVLIGDCPVLAFLADWMELDGLHPRTGKPMRTEHPTNGNINHRKIENNRQPKPDLLARFLQLRRLLDLIDPRAEYGDG